MSYRLGRYVLGPRIAEGGMGEVYLAVQEGLGEFQKPLALKLLLPHLMEDPRAVEMFLSEARVAARMSHPNVVQILDVGVEQGRYFLAMELVRGVSLATLLKVLKTSSLELDAATLSYVGRALCDALEHAHTLVGPDGAWHGVVHRDVTPHNLLVSVHGELKLTDFGIALARTGPNAAEGGAAGKLSYLAPEQLQGGPLDARADLYSAGITLFEAATGERPYSNLPPLKAREALAIDGLPPLPARFDAAFHQALVRCVAPSPDARFASARALRDAWPNLATSDTGRVLGEQVASKCHGAVEVLDEKTRTTLQLRHKTATLDASMVAPPALTMPVIDTSEPPPAPNAPSRPRRRRWPWVAAAVLGLGAAVAAGVWPSPPSEPSPVAEPTPPVAPKPEPTAPPPVPAPTVTSIAPTKPEPAAKPTEPKPTARPWGARPKTGRSKAEVASPAGIGYLTVDSKPWAEVRINGTRVGETPLARYPVQAGHLEITLHNPETGGRARKTVTVGAGREVSFRATLK